MVSYRIDFVNSVPYIKSFYKFNRLKLRFLNQHATVFSAILDSRFDGLSYSMPLKFFRCFYFSAKVALTFFFYINNNLSHSFSK